MIITKGDLVNGAYLILRISGLTVNPTPEDVEIALLEADDVAAELNGIGLNINWQPPAVYGASDPSDNSGLPRELAGPFKSILAFRLIDMFGKQATPTLALRAEKGMLAIEQITVRVPDSLPPSTLPVGSGNEYGYRDRTFFPEPPANSGASYVTKGDILNYSEDFSQWLIDETLVSVTWDSGGIPIGSETFNDTTATAELTFSSVGGFTVCITATKTNSTDVFTETKNFIVSDCANQSSSFIAGP